MELHPALQLIVLVWGLIFLLAWVTILHLGGFDDDD